MSLIPWRRGDWLPAFNSMVENFFNDEDFFNTWKVAATVPAVNVVETDTAYHLELAAPGMKKEDFNVAIKNGMLTISAATKTESEEKKDHYARREFSYSAFSRSFRLPENAMPENVNATYQDGILKMSLPKKVISKPEEQVRKIEVA